MSCRALIVATCCAALILGCERKPEQDLTEETDQRTATEVHPGMVAIAENLFVTSGPASIDEYVSFLRAARLPVPPRLLHAAANVRAGRGPVTGLTRKEAERFAIWGMKRLPTPQEWQTAGSIVGAGPYPYADEGPFTGALFLVRDWLPGSTAEAKARQASDELVKNVAGTVLQEQIVELRGALAELVTAKRVERSGLWEQLKPVLVELMEGQKKLQERIGEIEAQDRVHAHLVDLAKAKVSLAFAVVQQDADPVRIEQQAKAYSDMLAGKRAEIEKQTQQTTTAVNGLQDEVNDLTGRLEQVGKRAVDHFPRARAALDQAAAAIAAQEARLIRDRLSQAVDALKAAPAALPGFPTLEQARAMTRGTAERTERLTERKEAARIRAKIVGIKEQLGELGKQVEREFEQESRLLEDLDRLVESAATRAAITAKLQMLKDLVDKAAAAYGGEG